jgi:hypothetical protein
LRGASNNLATCLLSLDSTKETQKVHKHDTVRELRLGRRDRVDNLMMYIVVIGCVAAEHLESVEWEAVTAVVVDSLAG